jgi:hypothetical protein
MDLKQLYDETPDAATGIQGSASAYNQGAASGAAAGLPSLLNSPRAEGLHELLQRPAEATAPQAQGDSFAAGGEASRAHEHDAQSGTAHAVKQEHAVLPSLSSTFADDGANAVSTGTGGAEGAEAKKWGALVFHNSTYMQEGEKKRTSVTEKEAKRHKPKKEKSKKTSSRNKHDDAHTNGAEHGEHDEHDEHDEQAQHRERERERERVLKFDWNNQLEKQLEDVYLQSSGKKEAILAGMNVDADHWISISNKILEWIESGRVPEFDFLVSRVETLVFSLITREEEKEQYHSESWEPIVKAKDAVHARTIRALAESEAQALIAANAPAPLPAQGAKAKGAVRSKQAAPLNINNTVSPRSSKLDMQKKGIQIEEFGEIIALPAYRDTQAPFSNHYFPVGFRSTRYDFSLKSPNEKCLWVSEILRNDTNILFRVTCTESPDICFEGRSCTSVWRDAKQRIHEARQGQGEFNTNFSGPELFGLRRKDVVNRIAAMCQHAAT